MQTMILTMDSSRIFLLLLVFMTTLVNAQREYVVHACKDNMVRLNCRTGTIDIRRVILGDSLCSGSRCCPRSNDCNRPSKPDYLNGVKSSCNGQQHCSVAVDIRNIGCSWLGPNNDYVNITYTCSTPETSSTQSTFSSHLPIFALISKTEEDGKLETSSSSTSPSEKESHSMQPSNSAKTEIMTSTEWSSKRLSSSSLIPNFEPSFSKIPITSKYEAQGQSGDGNTVVMDRMTIITAVIVAGVVLTATVVSFAIVSAIKKRRLLRVVESSETYTMPNFPNSQSNTLESLRNSNIYEYIPDSGNCSARLSRDNESPNQLKEDDYLKPHPSEIERHYISIP